MLLFKKKRRKRKRFRLKHKNQKCVCTNPNCDHQQFSKRACYKLICPKCKSRMTKK